MHADERGAFRLDATTVFEHLHGDGALEVDLGPGPLLDGCRAEAFEHLGQSTEMIGVAVGQHDLLDTAAARALHGLLEHVEVGVDALARVDQDALGAGAHQIGVRARPGEGAGVLAERHRHAIGPDIDARQRGAQQDRGRGL